MAHKLKKLRLSKVALVPAGANPHAHITLFKSAEVAKVEEEDAEDGMDAYDAPLTTATRLARQQFWSQWSPLWDAFCASVFELLALCQEDASVATPLLLQSIDEFRVQAGPLLGSLGMVEKAAPFWAVMTEVEQEVSKAGRVMSAARMAQLRTAIATLQTILAEAGGMMEKGTTTMADETPTKALEDRLAKAEAEVQRLTLQLAKAQQTPEEQEAEFLKGLPEAVRKRWEADAIEKAALRQALEVEKEKRERAEYIEKTATYRAAGLAPDDWEVLKALDTLSEAPRDRVLTLLKALGEQVKASQLFRETGTSRGSASLSETAVAQLEQLIAAEQAKGDQPYAKAFQAVAKAHPSLYEAYTREIQARTRV